jgi:hypothetical protein
MKKKRTSQASLDRVAIFSPGFCFAEEYGTAAPVVETVFSNPTFEHPWRRNFARRFPFLFLDPSSLNAAISSVQQDE